MKFFVPGRDIKQILETSHEDFRNLNGANILLTGFTGFFGIWMLEALRAAQQQKLCKLELTVISRNPNYFMSKYPNLSDDLSINWINSDIRFAPKTSNNFSHIIHGATTSASETYSGQLNQEKFSVTYDGTKNILDIAKYQKNCRLIYLSSWAVYEESLHEQIRILDENYIGAPSPLNPQKTLGLAKRAAEALCGVTCVDNSNLELIIIRCFSFIGPLLPLEIHYAIGNFFKTANLGKDIIINSDGKAIRSYMYMSDCISWLIRTLTIDSIPGFPLHFASEEGFAIKEIAQRIANLYNVGVSINNADSPSPATKYLTPNTKLTRDFLNVEIKVPLDESLLRMKSFLNF